MEIKPGVKVFIKNELLGKYLFMLRDDKPDILHPNMWGLIGGGIEENEVPLEALRREIAEEIDAEILDIQELGKQAVVFKFNEGGMDQEANSHVTAYKAKTSSDLENINLFEGQKLGYFSIEEILVRNDLVPVVRQLIEIYKDKL